MKIGFGYDSHRLVTGRKLFLGGIEIPFEKGLLGHSDADVLVHAICDALLGAIGEGDMGRHFPDNDPNYENISSLKILNVVKKLADDKGFRINNIDSTIVLEKPKLMTYASEMAATMGKTLDIASEMINIKAKTNESMGLIGQGEGIIAFAIVTVNEIFFDKG